MHRCYLAPERWQDGVLIPDREEAHHLRDVLRVKPDDIITVLDGAGRRVRARVVLPGSGGVELVPANPKYPVIRPEKELTLGGIVRAVMRRY